MRPFVVVCVFAFVGCQPSKPTLSVKGAEVSAADFDGVTVDVEVEVSNPNGFAIFADEVVFDATLEQKPAARGVLKKRVNVDAKGSAKVKLPVRIRYAEVGAVASAVTKAVTWKWAVTGSVALAPTEEVVLRLPFAKDGVVDAPRLPIVSVRSSRLADVSLSAATVVVDVDVENPNAFALPGGTFAGTLKIGSASLPVTIAVPGVAAKKSGVVTVRQPLPLATLGKAAVDVAAGRSVDATVEGDFAWGKRTVTLKKTIALSR